MKIAAALALVITAITATATTNVAAADVMIRGAHVQSPMTTATATTTATSADATPAVDVRIATKDLLNNPTALLNKNALAMDNNVFIARSNLVFTQNDRLAMRKKVEEALTAMPATLDLADPAVTMTLTKTVMRAVSSSTDDKAVMSKASAIVAAKNDDASTISKKIADFVDAVATKEMDKEQEQAIQSETPRGIMVLVGTKDILRQPTAVANKNFVLSDNQVSIAKSNIAPMQNDQIVMAGGAKVADAIAPAAMIKVGQVKTNEDSDASADKERDQYRVAFAYPKEVGAEEAAVDDDMMDTEDAEKKKKSKAKTTTKKSGKKEQFGLWGAGWGLGWRYPLGWWNTFGVGLYGGGCGLGFAAGPFFYC